MHNLRNLIAVATLVVTTSCCSQEKAPLFSKDLTDSLEVRNTLVAFVGEKIAWEQLPYDGGMDAGVKATYRIIQLVYGNYEADTITFEAYDHYGQPSFLEHKHVLLFVSKHEDTFYHVKYQYFDLYKTLDGRWASPRREDFFYGDSSAPARPITYEEMVSYPTFAYDYCGLIYCIDYHYKQPNFRIEGDNAVAQTGTYLEELFSFAKNGVLRDRGFFGPPLQVEKRKAIVVQQVKIEPITWHYETRKLKRGTFVRIARQFLKSLAEKDTSFVRNHVLERIVRCNDTITADQFIADQHIRIWDSAFVTQALPTGSKFYAKEGKDSSYLSDETWTNSNIKMGKRTNVFHLIMAHEKHTPIKFYTTLSFVRTKNGFRLYSYTDSYDRTCNRRLLPGETFTGCDLD